MSGISSSESRERFLVDSDCDPELVVLLRKLGFRARSVLGLKIPNEDTSNLIWARVHGYILVGHDRHRDARTKYSFYSEMYYRGGRLIRIGGQPGQDALWALGKILAQRPDWQRDFAADSGEAVVSTRTYNFYSAETCFRRSRYSMRLPFEDPAVPVKERTPLPRKRQPSKKQRATHRLLE